VIVSTWSTDRDSVLDASLFLAKISPAEKHHVLASQLYDSAPETQRFVVPALFRVEVLAALARRNERDEVLDIVDAIVSGPRFYPVALEAPLLERAAEVARSARLRAYDAVYAALALERDAALVTLDRDVCSKLDAAFPEIVVVTVA
jgi:predicted nucleic acid-binding protein